MAALGPLPPAQGVLRVKMTGVANASPFMNGFYWKYFGAEPTSTAIGSFCNGFLNAWGTHLKTAFHSSVIMEHCEAYDLSSASGAYGDATQNIAGTRAGSPLPVNVAVCASLHVSYRWRGGHPRTYWTAGVQGDIANGREWTSAAQSAFEAGLQAWLTAVNQIPVNGMPGHLIAVRYVQTVDGVPQYFPVPLQLDVTSISVGLRIDSQRRRLGKELS